MIDVITKIFSLFTVFIGDSLIVLLQTDLFMNEYGHQEAAICI